MEMIKTTLSSAIILVLLSAASGQSDVIYPTMKQFQRLVTRINCQITEPQHFRYSSVTELWGLTGGQILLEADVVLRCLGDDRGGKFESEALKYRVEVSDILITEKKHSPMESLTRHKRGVGDFFSKQWQRMKQFFKQIFGRKTKPPQVTDVHVDVSEDARQDTPPKEEPEEAINQNDYISLYSTPFLFVQLANGSIPEVRFSENETDSRVKNFKRHLVDTFSTQLNFNQKESSIVEKSVIGEHKSTYNISVNDPEPMVSIAGMALLKDGEPLVVVNKVVTGSDILQLAPSEAINDREKMNLLVEQVQVFHKGRMISSSGMSSLSLLPTSESQENRIKRDVEEDATSYIQAHSSFDIQLQKRTRRSSTLTMTSEKDEDEAFIPASRFAEIEDDSEKEDLRALQKSTVGMAEFLESMPSDKDDDYDEKMQVTMEIVEREIKHEMDNESDSVSNSIRRLLTKEKVQNLCSRNSTVCKDYLQLLALAGGREAEEVLLSFLTQTSNFVSAQMIADIISDVSKPSSDFLRSLRELIENRSLEPDTTGAICLTLGHLGSKANVEDKRVISNVLTELLEERRNTCRADPFIVDVLEAIGNLNCEHPVPSILKVSAECSEVGAVQIACAHALRHAVHLPEVQRWVHLMVTEGDCEILREVVGSLMDKIQDQEMIPDVLQWPRFDFNAIDSLVKEHLTSGRCPSEDILLYFSRKRNTEANEAAHNLFGQESEAWNVKTHARQKRAAAAWDDLNCKEWTEDSKYRPIQDTEEFAADRETYNKRRSCLAFRRLGVRGASTDIYAGMFAGVKDPSDPPKYKLFTKFVSALNFLGHQLEIGSFYFYHHSGKTRAYVRIMGRTRQEFTNDGCTPTDLRYRPLRHIPLYLMNFGPVQLSLGIHLSSQLALDTECPKEDVYQLAPLTNVRIGGEAMGNVLFARGAVNLGGNFNYKLQFTFTPSPDMCIKGSHGYDPMSISIEAYYQLWNSLKADWGKPRVWKPSFLSWDVTRGNMKQWFDDTCIATESEDSSFIDGREIE